MWPPPHGCGEPVFHAVSDEGEALLVLILTSNTPPALGLPETENQDEYLSSLCLSSPSHGLLGPEMGRFPASTIQASWPSCHRQNQTLHAWKQFYDRSCCLFLFTCILKFLGLPCHLVLLEVLSLVFPCLAFEFCVYLGI